MLKVPFALYDAFTDSSFGGSQAGIVSNAQSLDSQYRQKIAQEIGVPATAFVSAYDAHSIDVQFYSTVGELPMCGHGTICLITRMVELDVLSMEPGEGLVVDLILPTTRARVTVSLRADNRPVAMLEIEPAKFHQQDLDLDRLAGLLSLNKSDFHPELPVETANGDFVHLVVPVRNLKTMGKIQPDFDGIVSFCHQHNIETVVAFSTETENRDSTIHVRDFCPAVGVAESAAAGTTNAALSCYLIRNQIAPQQNNGQIIIHAEQGHEINRPSKILSIAEIKNDELTRLRVGGVATKVFDGELYLPEQD